MDHARSFDYVQQLPRTTISEVHSSGTTYSHQVLLNETWADYCKRRQQPPHRAKEEHEKWITETWDEYLSRVVIRSRTLADFDAQNDAAIAAREESDEHRAQIGNNVINMMMVGEKRRIEQTREPCSLTLLLDFEELRQQRFSRERLAIEDEEAAKRQWIIQEQDSDWETLIGMFNRRLQQIKDEEEAKRKAEEERIRQEQEAKRKEEEERKAAEEAKRRAELEAERKRRAEEEEAKRAERKRKEEERRQKAKAEREARNKATAGSSVRPPSADEAAPSKKEEEEKQSPTVVNTGRINRLKRMNDTISSSQQQQQQQQREETLEKIRQLATQCETIEEYCQKLCDFIGNGNILFHTCMYIGCVLNNNKQQQQQEKEVNYFAASENCSEQLRSGETTLKISDSPSLTQFSDTKNNSSLGPFDIVSGEKEKKIVPLVVSSPTSSETWPPTSGQCAFFPILLNSKQENNEKEFWGVIGIDTASCNKQDPLNSFQLPQEQDCYPSSSSSGTQKDVLGGEPVEITNEIISFMNEVAGITSSAANTLPSKNATTGGDWNIDLDKLRSASNLGNLLAVFTNEVRNSSKNISSGVSTDAPVDCYISMISQQQSNNNNNKKSSALCIAHNGFALKNSASAKERDPEAPHHLVGGKLTESSAKTFSFSSSSSQTESNNNSCSFVEDVSSDSSIALYDKALQQEKQQGETLLLIPIITPVDTQFSSKNNKSSSSSETKTEEKNIVWGVIGVSNITSPELAQSLSNLFWNNVRSLILGYLKQAALHSVCRQAVEWLSIATGFDNIYIALTHSREKKSSAENLSSNPLEIVCASSSQQFLIGRNWTKENDGGISHDFVSSVVGKTHEVSATSKHISSLASSDAEKVKYFRENAILSSENESEEQKKQQQLLLEKSQLLLCSISQNKSDANVHGILYCDTFTPNTTKQNSSDDASSSSSKKKSKSKKSSSNNKESISPSDIDVFKLTAQLLAATLDNDDEDDSSSSTKLSIETDIEQNGGGSSQDIAFLSRLYRYATNSVKGISSNQLSELARYPSPPPVIPQTVCSAVILLGNSKMKNEWDSLRKKIKQEFLDKIVAFDPTSKKGVKKSCVVKSKKLTSGLTASDVFTKGSHPASCLFTWVFISLLLRKFAKTIRDRGEDDEADKQAMLRTLAATVAGKNNNNNKSVIAEGEEEDEDEDDLAVDSDEDEGDDEGEVVDEGEDAEDEDEDEEE